MKVYEIVQDLLLKSLATGTAPWHRPWAGKVTTNYATGKEYHGCNAIMLPMQTHSQGLPIPDQYIGFKQAKAKGLELLPEFKHSSVICVYYGQTKETEEKDAYKFLRYSRVYPAYAFGIETPTVKAVPKWSDIKSARDIVMGYDMDVEHGGNAAFYCPSKDNVVMPPQSTFESATGYYGALFHELAHSTGHKSRLDRQIKGKFGSPTYAREELVAEVTSAYLCWVAGIDHECTIENSAAYIANWSKVIQDAGTYIVSAFSQAEKAANYILTNGASHA